MKLRDHIIKLADKIPYNQYLKFKKNSWVPAGHFYSPLVLIDEVKKRESEIWNIKNKEEIKGIDLRTEEQIQLLKSFTQFYEEIPFKATYQTNVRYQFENGYYSYSDGITLYSMIRYFKPKKIIEIGSGFSSAVMLDTNDLFFDNQIHLTFIEPFPDRLISIMKENDKVTTTVIKSDVQKVSIDNFEKLDAGDILFVDSTHVAKTGSDVNYILFEVLPSLKSGVLIHFHDVFYPFEYPKEWVYEGRSWNEDYFLKAFLMYNDKFEIKLFTDYIHKHHRMAFKEMPLAYKNTGANFWILKK